MPVRGVLAKTRVCDDDHVGHGATHGANGLLHDAALRVSARRGLVLRLGQPEEYDSGDAHLERVRGLARDLVDREVEDARHRRYFAPHALAGTRKERQYQVLSSEPCLAHERTHRLGTPQTSRSVYKPTTHLFLTHFRVAFDGRTDDTFSTLPRANVTNTPPA